MRMKSRTKYYWWSGYVGCVVILKPNGKMFNHMQDNTIQPIGFNDPETMKLRCPEITYHQYIMWLCFGEPIVV